MKQFLSPLGEIIGTLLIALVAFVIIRFFIAQPFIVDGSSMEPNFHDGDILLIDEITYRVREPERGEVIVFKNPQNESEFYIKRIVGLPGETVIISGESVKVNGVALDETYLPPHGLAVGENVTYLEGDEYFVMGDNRDNSRDSRIWGPLKEYKIIGAVRLRFWPPTKLEIFRQAVSYNFS